MENVKSFSIEGVSYNVARATAVQQDEVLSLLTITLIQRFMASIQEKIEVDEETIFALILALPFSLKVQLDSLLLSRITKHGENLPVTIRDFDGQVMGYNRLRAKVLMWNLEGFFTYWAKESKSVIDQLKAQQAMAA